MVYRLPADLAQVADLQRGVLSFRQLHAGGLTWGTVRSRVGLGQWQRLYRGIYATFSGEPGREAELWAAVLACGPGAMLSYQTAAELAGLADKRSWLVHVTVPSEQRIAGPPGLVVHHSSRASQALHPARLPPQTRIEETILDLASAAKRLDDACRWVTAGVGRRLTSESRLDRAMAQRGKMRWRPELEELLSPVAKGGLPGGRRQAPARRGNRNEYRDQLYEAYGVALELDGRLAHPADRRWEDIRRDNAAVANRISTLRYGWIDIARLRPPA